MSKGTQHLRGTPPKVPKQGDSRGRLDEDERPLGDATGLAPPQFVGRVVWLLCGETTRLRWTPTQPEFWEVPDDVLASTTACYSGTFALMGTKKSSPWATCAGKHVFQVHQVRRTTDTTVLFLDLNAQHDAAFPSNCYGCTLPELIMEGANTLSVSCFSSTKELFPNQPSQELRGTLRWSPEAPLHAACHRNHGR